MPGPPPISPLETVPLFRCLTPSEKDLLAPYCRLRAYEKGEVIFTEGELARNLYFIVLGRVKVVKSAPGRDVIIEIFGPGEPVGVLAAFEEKSFPASAVPLESSSLLEIPAAGFFSVVDAHPEMTRRLLKGLILRQVELARRLADLTGSVEYRVARLFLTLAERTGVSAGGSIEIPVSLTRQDIADLAATTVETSIRIMSRWGREGLVITHPKGFTIPDVDGLKKRVTAESG
ncbi:MAG: Crp/Fnr family transcriptional regulator [Acidobacteria bacterium]|nr:Crp/Fnr family transcriptional regulator [Acidobacteriota bacterium]MCG3193629.1 CRP-like cAMP-activated global transcriptional regulator [Thermoanaerobaculia bacterium]MCK6682898.1 Crp/Fnr family transcriptional regulator [Thermoanaerobaculia bacterium]